MLEPVGIGRESNQAAPYVICSEDLASAAWGPPRIRQFASSSTRLSVHDMLKAAYSSRRDRLHLLASSGAKSLEACEPASRDRGEYREHARCRPESRRERPGRCFGHPADLQSKRRGNTSSRGRVCRDRSGGAASSLLPRVQTPTGEAITCSLRRRCEHAITNQHLVPRCRHLCSTSHGTGKRRGN